MSWLAWMGIVIMLAFLVYFVFFFGRKKKSRPLTRVQPRAYQSYGPRAKDFDGTPIERRQNRMRDDEFPSTPESRRRQRAAIQEDHADDYLFASALSGTLNSEPRIHVHDSDRITPEDHHLDPAPTSHDIPGSSHFETGGGFGGDSGFSSGSDGGGSDGGSSDSGGGGDSGGGSND